MNNELDLREYAVTLLRRWPIILVVTVIVSLAAGIFGLLRPPTYLATATLEAAPPAYTWRFDMAIQSVVDTRQDPRDTVLPLAETFDLFVTLSDELGGSPSPETLQAMCSTRRGTGYLFYQEVEDSDAERAAAIANRWAELVVALADPATQDLQLFERELQVAEEDVLAAVAQLEAFRAETGRVELGLGLATGSEDDALFTGMSLDQQRMVLKTSVLADYEHALDQLRLVIGAAGHGGDLGELPLQLLATPVLEARGKVTPEALAALGEVGEVLARLREEEAALETVIEGLRADTDQLQADLAQEESELAELLRQRALALETANHLERKVAELQVQQRVGDGGVRIVGRARAPKAPAGASLPIALGAGVVVGLVLGTLVALAWEFLSRLRPKDVD